MTGNDVAHVESKLRLALRFLEEIARAKRLKHAQFLADLARVAIARDLGMPPGETGTGARAPYGSKQTK